MRRDSRFEVGMKLTLVGLYGQALSYASAPTGRFVTGHIGKGRVVMNFLLAGGMVAWVVAAAIVGHTPSWLTTC